MIYPAISIIYRSTFLENLPKNEIKKFLAPKPVKNSINDFVCTFRKKLEEISVDE